MGVVLKNKSQGFTIIELMVVIVVIGILATIITISYDGIQRDVRDSERSSDIEIIKSALETYYNQKGSYPVSNASSISSTIGELNLTPESVRAPGVNNAATPSLITNGSYPPAPNVSEYVYQSFTSSTASSANLCTTTSTPCTSYELSWRKEKDNTVVTVRSQYGW